MKGSPRKIPIAIKRDDAAQGPGWGMPHFAVGPDVIAGGRRIDGQVMSAEFHIEGKHGRVAAKTSRPSRVCSIRCTSRQPPFRMSSTMGVYSRNAVWLSA